MREVRAAKRMLAVVEMMDGSVLGVELTPLNRALGLQYAIDAWPGDGSTYLGEGRWDLAPGARVDLSASGLYTATMTGNPAAWLAEKAGNTPERAKKAVYGSRSPERGGNG